MFVTLGARASANELVDLLAACHRRIRSHVTTARRLVAAGQASPPGEIREAASQIRRYFTLALPLHVADEDQTIAPHLQRSGPDVTRALTTLTAEHVAHQPLIDQLVELCAELERDPAVLPAVTTKLSQVVETLASELATHLELEEQVVFPMLRQLPESERMELLAAIRRRRGDARDHGEVRGA